MNIGGPSIDPELIPCWDDEDEEDFVDISEPEPEKIEKKELLKILNKIRSLRDTSIPWICAWAGWDTILFINPLWNE